MLINILVSIKCGMVFINEIKISDIISIISLICPQQEKGTERP